MTHVSHYDSPLGGITLAEEGGALTGLWFDGQKHFPAHLDGSADSGPTPALIEAMRWLDAYFSGRDPDFTPLLAPQGTAFQRAVWDLLLTIPYGETVTYGHLADQLARRTGKPASARAVGGAVGRNPISLIVPCHRVVGADGSLTGYAGGVERKARLLALERDIASEGE